MANIKSSKKAIKVIEDYNNINICEEFIWWIIEAKNLFLYHFVW